MTEQTDAAPVSAAADARPLFKPADPSHVRIAGPADRDGVEALARLMHAEVGMFRLNPQKLRETINLGIKHRLIGVVGDPVPVGVLCLAVERMHYTDDLHLSDKFFFVHPEHRRSAHARSLIEWAKRTREAIGVPLFIGVFNTTRTEAKARLMERRLDYCGSIFVHGLPRLEALTSEPGEIS